MLAIDPLSLTSYCPQDIVFLCGAGISLDEPTCIPTVNAFLKDTLAHCNVSDDNAKSVLKNVRTAYRFESMIEEICKLGDKKQKVTQIFNSNTYNKIHSFLSNMIGLGATVLTTNFDNCIENANKNNRYNRLVFSGEDIEKKIISSSSMLLKIHGSNPLPAEKKNKMLITLSALSSTAKAFRHYPYWKESILNIINNKILVVIGYSCSDDFDITPLLLEAKPKKVLWLDYSYNDFWPRLCSKSDNDRIESLRVNLPITIYACQPISYLEFVASRFGFTIDNGLTSTKQYTIRDYLSEVFPTKEQKTELINQILLTSTLYEKVISSDTALCTDRIILQNIKASYLLGYYERANELINTYENTLEDYICIAELYYYKSSVLFYMGKKEDALDIANIYFKCIQHDNDKAVLAHANNHLAAIKFSLGQIDDAEHFYKRALHMSEQFSIEAEATALWGLADVQSINANHYEAISYYEKAYKLFYDIGKNYSLGFITRNMAESYVALAVQKNDKYTKAAKLYLSEAKKRFSEPRNETGILYVNLTSISLYMKIKEYNTCRILFEESFDILEVHANIPLGEELRLYYKDYLRHTQ